MSAEQPSDERLSAAERLALEELCDQFEAALREGHAIPIADLLADTTGLFRRTLAHELLAVELEHRAARGEQPKCDDYRHLDGLIDDERAALLARFSPVPTRSTSVGYFQLLEHLGKGAFGAVWKAEDTRLGRQVALKLAHANLVEDPERFLREARATAQLQHPNIVRVLDVGEVDGQMFIVREFIEGRSLSEVMRDQPYGPRRAAEICRHLADALVHSHALGCVHRDIKPQNVLMDSSGMPHLLDFGLAKFAAPDAVTTRTGDIMGTPAYMSPEQARGDSRQADARTDVYSLGVVLFEMLTGERPFRGTIEMIVVQILNDEPPNPVRLRRDVPADLATICLKCLEKEPARRYASAAELVADLGRFLEGRPIVARPVSLTEHALRWAGRNRTVAALLSMVFLLMIALAVGSFAWSVTLKHGLDTERELRGKANKAQLEASSAATAAKAEAEISAQVTLFLENVFAPSDPLGLTLRGGKQERNNTFARDLVLRAVERIDGELAGQPRVQARLMDVLGNVLRSVGSFAEADRLLTRAAELRVGLVKGTPSLDLRAEIATNVFYRGWLKHAQGDYAAATPLYEQALKVRLDLAGPDSLPVGEVEFHLGWLHLERRDSGKAKAHFLQSLQIRKQHLPVGHPLVVFTQAGLVQCSPDVNELSALATSAEELMGKETAGKVLVEVLKVQIARKFNDYAVANAGYRELLVLLAPHFDNEHPVIALIKGDFASCLWEAGEYIEAEAAAAEALRVGRRFAPHHPQMLRALKQVAFEMLYAGRWIEAEKLYREALAIPGQSDHSRAEITHGLIWSCLLVGKRPDALAFSEQTLALGKGSSLGFSAWIRHCHARMLTQDGRPDEAANFDAEALRLAREVDMSKQTSISLDRFAVIFNKNGDFVTGEKLLRQALQQEEKARPADHPRVADRLHALGGFLLGRNRPVEAAPLLRRALAIREKRLPADDQRLADSRKKVASVADVP